MLKSILIGLGMTVVTVVIHALGTTWWTHRLRRGTIHEPTFWQQMQTLCGTATLLLSLLICEVVVWAITYMLLPTLDEVDTLEQATYFSLVTYTTLGYGDIVIADSWRVLSGIQAINGLLIFGWSTALFFAMYRRLFETDDA